jgi:hypothetical protein
MSRSLNVTELNQLDAMMDRTSPGAIALALATLCSIVASEHSAYSNGKDQWETRANILNNACDLMTKEGV